VEISRDRRAQRALPSKGKSAGENVSYQHDESDFQNQELLFDGGVTRVNRMGGSFV
jgi:hypothetical protein